LRYVREFQSGTGGSDPRNKWYAVYQCDACGAQSDLHMPDRGTFIRRERPCPKCGALNPESLRKSLESKKASLEAQSRHIQSEIEKVIEELSRIPMEEMKE
jgi:hypothetical protein